MDEGDIRAAHGGGTGKGIAHLAGGMVGEVAHRVQRLLRGAGGDGNAQTGKIFGPGNGMQDILDQHIFLRQTAAANILAGQHAALGGDHREAVAFQRGDIILRDGVFQHSGIHGWRNELGALCSQHCGGEHIIGDAVGHLGDDVGSGRGDKDHIGFFCQRDVGDFKLEIPVKGVHHAFVAGEGLKGERSDELGGVPGHNDLHIGSQLAQCAGHIGHFIGGNAAAYAQKDAFSVQIHWSNLLQKRTVSTFLTLV